MLSVARYLRHYLRPVAAAVTHQDTTYQRAGEALEATVLRPARTGRRLPGWVVLHGLTHAGRHHPELLRFAAAVAATGRVVFVPDIPEWRALRVAPAITVATIRAAVRALHDRPDVEPDRVGLIGFSFGATQGLVAAADPELRGLLRGIVAWGGYHDLQRLTRFGLTGEHELDGQRYRLEPDPYGCWVMSANYLTCVPGYEAMADVATAVHALAAEAGRRRIYAWEPVFDALKVELREPLAPERRRVFDMLAPLTTTPRDVSNEAVALADGLARAAVRVDPLLAPGQAITALRVPVLLAHGRDDRLVPFSESVRMSRALPPSVRRGVLITGLFAHSGGTLQGLGAAGTVRETARFLNLLYRTLGMIG